MTATLYTDGAAFGNPGPSGLGIVLYGNDKQLVAERSIPAGHGTNNEAEYRALIEGLRLAAEHGIRELTARMDSMLVARFRTDSGGWTPYWAFGALHHFSNYAVAW